MVAQRAPEDATLLDVLIDGFEKNEILDGFHWRSLPKVLTALLKGGADPELMPPR